MPPRASAPSAFVTVTAKVSLAVGVAATAYAVLQAAVAMALLGADDGARVVAALPTTALPPAVAWTLVHLRVIAWAALGLSAAFLAVSWGLLRRRPWGWWGFVAFMVLGALANFAGIALVQHLFDWVDALPRHPDPDLDALQGTLATMRAASLAAMWATAVAFAALHGLVVWQLCRPAVRAEFAAD